MQANQLAAFLALGISAGTLFFAGMGIHAKHDFFLLLGNVCCLFGNVAFVFAMSSVDDAMAGASNETWRAVFGALALLSLYATYRMFRKYQRLGCDDDDDDDEDEGDEAAQAAAETARRARQERKKESSTASTSSSSAKKKPKAIKAD